MFEFRFCNLKFFWIQATGFCKDWGMAARPFSSAQDCFKNQPKIFLELSVSMGAKKLP
jgi:hypothetical protein